MGNSTTLLFYRDFGIYPDTPSSLHYMHESVVNAHQLDCVVG